MSCMAAPWYGNAYQQYWFSITFLASFSKFSACNKFTATLSLVFCQVILPSWSLSFGSAELQLGIR
ncbi:MAG: hypothetical protein ACLFMQ_00625, partial [Desulfohalobiaceae bacterium]